MNSAMSPDGGIHGPAYRQADRPDGAAGLQAVLRRSRAFATWPESALGRLAGQSRTIWLERGQPLCRAGERREFTYVVQAGWLMLQAQSGRQDGRNAVALLGEGLVVCSLMPGEGLFGSFQVSAQRDTALVELASAALLRQLDESPHLWADLTLALLEQEEELLATVVGQATGSVGQRVARTVLQYVQLCGLEPGGADEGGAVRLKMTQDELGFLLQLSRKTVGRELRALEELGLIVRAYNHILVRDLAALRAHAERGILRRRPR